MRLKGLRSYMATTDMKAKWPIQRSKAHRAAEEIREERKDEERREKEMEGEEM